MRGLRLVVLAFIASGPCAVPRPVAGAEPGSPEPPKRPASAPVLSPESDLTGPMLQIHPDATYPPAALQAHLEADVGLELDVAATGAVGGVRVIKPAGHGFDEAATSAARRFLFEPARRGRQPVPAIVQITYQFRLPGAPVTAPEPPNASPSTAPPHTQQPPPVPPAPASQSTTVLGSRPRSAASAFSVTDRELALRPIGGVQDILRVTPGLVIVQHSGGGKANQYFLRGFDADHGTDIALSIDGVPINMVSHAHGQGFADTNFVIPEVVERLEITKGPYFASQGDFATAGALGLVSRDEFEQSSVSAGLLGSPGQGRAGYRMLLIASPALDLSPHDDRGDGLGRPRLQGAFAADVGRTNGPFEHPDKWDHARLFGKLTFKPSDRLDLSLTEMSYAGNWNGSGQLPARAVEEGQVTRFGSLDPTEGGDTARHQIAFALRLRPNDAAEFRALAYVGSYRFNLYSNFTFLLRDPTNGDQIEQIDQRVFYGARISYRFVRQLGRVMLDTTFGADSRSDDIHAELWNTAARQQLMEVRDDDVHESFLDAYLNEEISPLSWLRADVGGRVDLLSFSVDDRLPVTDPASRASGVGAAHQWSPKLALIATPIARPQVASLDLFLDYGHGFHSNDVRGVFRQPAVTPLARATGEELGARARLWGRWDLAAALWALQLSSESVWDGDTGTTVASDATTRRGVELETRYDLTPWLAADLALTFTRSRFSTDHANGGGLALAPKQTWAGGLSGRHRLGPGTARGGLRFFGIGDRPATDDGALVAPGFTEVDLHLGYRHRWFDVAFDVENLFDAEFRSAQFATTSRLGNEPAIGSPVPPGFTCGRSGRLAAAPGGAPAAGLFFGCEDVSYTPAYPLTVRLLATLFVD